MIRLAFGSCTFPHGSTRVNTYAFHRNQEGQTTRVLPGVVLDKDSRARGTRQEAGQGGDHGYWSFSDYNSRDGQILMIQASTTKYGKPWSDGAVLVRLRDDAPLIQVTVHTVTARANLLPHIQVFHGRGDVLTVREANKSGAKLDLNFIERYFNHEEVEELFSVRELAEGSPKPTTKTLAINGKEKTVTKRSGRRKIKLRRQS